MSAGRPLNAYQASKVFSMANFMSNSLSPRVQQQVSQQTLGHL
jgi:hypothetical protein